MELGNNRTGSRGSANTIAMKLAGFNEKHDIHVPLEAEF